MLVACPLRLQRSKEWSTSGASGVAGNDQLVCHLRSPGGTVTVANEDLDALKGTSSK